MSAGGGLKLFLLCATPPTFLNGFQLNFHRSIVMKCPGAYCRGLTTGSRSRSLLLKIEIQTLLNYLSLLLPIDSKLGVLVAYIKRQLGFATQASVIKVKVTVAKNRNSVSA